MSNSNHVILCSACNVPLEIRVDHDHEFAVCPICGIFDTKENVIREAGESLVDKLARGMFGPEGTTGSGCDSAKSPGPDRHNGMLQPGDNRRHGPVFDSRCRIPSNPVAIRWRPIRASAAVDEV